MPSPTANDTENPVERKIVEAKTAKPDFGQTKEHAALLNSQDVDCIRTCESTPVQDNKTSADVDTVLEAVENVQSVESVDTEGEAKTISTLLSALSVSSKKALSAAVTPISDVETFVSIDVEAAAIGRTHAYRDRAACWAVVVDSTGKELLNLVIDVPNLVSPLTKVTGLTAAEIHAGIPLEDALDQIHTLLCSISTNVTIVGQSVQGDIDWLKLEKGVHYNNVVDLSESFKTWNPKYRNFNFYSLAKEAYGLLGVRMHGGSQSHNPLVDAQVSMRLYNEFVAVPSKLARAKSTLVRLTRRKQFPRELMAGTFERNIDGCCGWAFNPDKCICGAPTLRTE